MAPGREHAGLGKRQKQRRPFHGLDEVLDGAERNAEGAVLHDRDDDDRDRAAQRQDQLARDRQAQPGPTAAAMVLRLALAKLLEDRLLLFFRDADAGVLNDQGPAVVLARLRAYEDRSPVGELQGVSDEVGE